MKWYQDALSRRYAIWGLLAGLAIPIIGTFTEVVDIRHLHFTLSTIWTAQLDEPLLWIMDTAPLLLGFIGGILGMQRRLTSTIEHGKKEWETIFDSISDLIFLTDSEGIIVRCNHAVIDRLNAQYANVIGRPISEILTPNEQGGIKDLTKSIDGFFWLSRLYIVSTVPIDVEGPKRRSLFILRDITRRKQAEAALTRSETLFRALFDLSPDAVIVIDPHDPNVSWPIIDCNLAACVMNGYQREELIGHSVDILNLTSGTPEERTTYLNRLREAGKFNLETYHHRKNGEQFPVEVSTTLIKAGERELIIGIDRDITERKQVEDEL